MKGRTGFTFIILTVLAISAFANVLVLTSSIYMMQVYDRVLPTRNTDTLIYLTFIALGAVLAYGVLDGLRHSVLMGLAQWWEQRIRPQVIGAALVRIRAGDSEAQSGLQDVGAVRAFLSGSATAPVFDAMWVPIFLVAIWLLHPLLGLFAIVSAGVLFVLAILNEWATRKLIREGNAQQRAVDGQAAQFFRGADTVRAMGMASAIDSMQHRAHAEQLRLTGRSGRIGGMLGGLTKGFRFAIQIGILALGALLVVRGELTGGVMIASSIILGRALAPVEQLIGSYRVLTTAREANGRLKKLITYDDGVKDAMLLPTPSGRLQVENASFTPPGAARATVDGVTFSIEPGTALALIGPSGSGKTTLCRLITGAVTVTSGAIRIDGAEIEHWNRDQLGRAIGYVPQMLDIFAGTVRANIARFSDATDADVVEAAEAAGCHQMILGLPKGYDSEVGDGGRFLSGGQRQRIALARALFGKPNLVILDEATAFLDGDGESALVEATKALRARNATVILVTHRPSLLTHMTQVAILQAGKITTIGDRDSVMRQLRLVPNTGPRTTPATTGAATI